jgi:hypothetical protein
MMGMERSAELRDLMLRIYQALASGEADYFDQLASRQEGLIAIGTDPAEWWPDYGSFVGALRAQLREMGGGFPITPGDPQAFREGSVGWVADRPTLALPDSPPLPFRLTMVFHREADGWKAV